MTQAPPFGSGMPQTSLLPSGTPVAPEQPKGSRGLGRTQLIAIGGGVVGVAVLGAAAWYLLGSGGDTPVDGSAPVRVSAKASVSPSPGASAGALLAGSTTRNPFAGGGALSAGSGAAAGATGGSTAGATSAPTTVPAVPLTTPTSVATTPAAATATVTATVTTTVRSTVTATPSAAPSAIYVGLYGWVTATQGTFLVNTTSSTADVGSAFDGVTYVGQSGPNAQSQMCAVVRLSTAGAAGDQTVCPGEVVKLR